MAGSSSLYGFAELDLEGARSLLERALEVELRPHDSLYRGGDYYLLKEPDAELILQQNYDCLDDDLAESDFPAARVLLYVDGERRAQEIAELLGARIPEAALLRRASY